MSQKAVKTMNKNCDANSQNSRHRNENAVKKLLLKKLKIDHLSHFLLRFRSQLLAF